MIVSVRIYPWLKQFLISIHGNPPPATFHTVEGAFLLGLLKEQPKQYQAPYIDPYERLDMEVPEFEIGRLFHHKRKKVYCPEGSFIRFQHGVSSLFKDMMFMYLYDKVRYNGKKRAYNLEMCIYQFCIDHQVHMDEQFYELGKKILYRTHKNKYPHVEIGG